MGYYTNRKRTQKLSKRSVIIVGVIAVAIIMGLAYGGWRYYQHRQTKSKPVATTTNQAESKIDMNPATSEEKKESEQHKDEIIEQQKNQTTNPAPTGGNVTPIISYADQYGSNIEVAAFVATVVEDGGTCTLTATSGTNKVTKQVTAVRNAKNTTCPTFSIPRSEFKTAGTWSVVVSYSSTAYNGTSEAKSVEVK